MASLCRAERPPCLVVLHGVLFTAFTLEIIRFYFLQREGGREYNIYTRGRGREGERSERGGEGEGEGSYDERESMATGEGCMLEGLDN